MQWVTTSRSAILYSCAPGKAILSFLPEAEFADWIKGRRLKRFTATTLADRASLEAELERSRGRGYAVDDAMVADFRTYLESRKVRIDDQSFTTDLPFIRAMIQYDIDLALFGVEEARRNLVARDPQAQFALQQFEEAARLPLLKSTKSTAARQAN